MVVLLKIYVWVIRFFIIVKLRKPGLKLYVDIVNNNTDYSCLNLILSYNIVRVNKYGDTSHESISKSQGNKQQPK